MRKLHTAPAIALTVLLSACGSGDLVVNRGELTLGTETPSVSPIPSTLPDPSNDSGTYPAYPFTDYAYTLRLSCFCPNAGAPYRINVQDGEVTQVSHKGDVVTAEWLNLTLNDIIAAANDAGAHEVNVRWPQGQDHPTSVWVDQSRLMVDEERGYHVSDVVNS